MLRSFHSAVARSVEQKPVPATLHFLQKRSLPTPMLPRLRQRAQISPIVMAPFQRPVIHRPVAELHTLLPLVSLPLVGALFMLLRGAITLLEMHPRPTLFLLYILLDPSHRQCQPLAPSMLSAPKYTTGTKSNLMSHSVIGSFPMYAQTKAQSHLIPLEPRRRALYMDTIQALRGSLYGLAFLLLPSLSPALRIQRIPRPTLSWMA